MSYINEINGFHKWVQTHPELPTSARILWFTLMHYNNSCGWKRVFNVPISLLMGDSGLSRSSIVRARKLLQESGRIRYTTRSDMKATEYELLPMSDEPGIATGYDTYTTRRDTEHDTGYDKGYTTERDTLHDTVYDTGHDTKDDTVYDTPHDIVYDNTCDIAHDTQDGHIPRLNQTRQDQTNTIQDTNTRQDNQTRPDSLSEFSFSGGEKKEKEKKKMLTVRTTLICMVTSCMMMKCMMAPCMMTPCMTITCMITKCMMTPCTTTTCVITKYMMTTCITTTCVKRK